MRIFRSKALARAARKASLPNSDFVTAVRRAEKGIIDANLGHGLIKQRIPRKNEGRSGGFRSLLFYRKGRLAVFVHLFAKNAVDNISAEQLHALASIAKELGKLTASQISQLTQTGLWEEIDDSD